MPSRAGKQLCHRNPLPRKYRGADRELFSFHHIAIGRVVLLHKDEAGHRLRATPGPEQYVVRNPPR